MESKAVKKNSNRPADDSVVHEDTVVPTGAPVASMVVNGNLDGPANAGAVHEEEKLSETSTVDSGVLQLVDWGSASIVIAEHWPSWAFALQALGCSELYTVVESMDRFVLDLGATSIGDSLNDLDQLDNVMSSVNRPNVFMQGSAEFTNRMRVRFSTQAPSWASLTCVVPRHDAHLRKTQSLFSRTVSHKSVGGVTNGQWTVYSTVRTKLPVTAVRRTLKHVLSSTEGASDQLLPNDTPLLGTDRVQVGVERKVVRTPSVFDTTKLGVLRMITCSEWMQIYDLGLSTQHSLKNYSRSEGLAVTRAFVHAAPLKLLVAVGRSIGASLRHLAVATAVGTGSPLGNAPIPSVDRRVDHSVHQ